MESIEIDIDNDVYAYLKKHARPFVDTPNSTIRRLLGIGDAAATTKTKKSSPAVDDDLEESQAESLAAARNRFKAPKADLEVLIQSALLRNGQKLYLIDYKGNKVQKLSPAVISGGDVIFNNQRYSMSSLAQELLAKVGFNSRSVRGPAHWVTEDGESIKELWMQYLDRNAKK